MDRQTMKCDKCGDDLRETRKVIETGEKPGSTLVLSGLVSEATGKQSCRKGGPHRTVKAERMSSTEIWDAINQQQGRD